MMTWVKANEIKKALQDNEDYVAVVYDVKTGYELQFVYGVPGARICVLQCIDPDKILIMPRDEFDQLHKTEGDVIAKATDNNQ